MKPIKRKELESILVRRSCARVHGAEHDIWTCGTCKVAVPRHQEISAGVLRTIMKNLTPCLGEGWLTR